MLQKIDAPSLVEQVIAVPKISLDRIPQRSVCRRPQKAEQLVEVPTIVSFSSLQQQTAEQIIDIPVPGRGGGGRGGLQDFSSGQNPAARPVEQIVDFPVPAGGLRDLPDPGGSSSSAASRDERGEGGFRTFLRGKKSPPRVRVRGCPQGRAHGLRRLVAVTTPGSWSCRGCAVLAVEPSHWDAGSLVAGKCTPMAPVYTSSLRWCTSPLTNFDRWCVVSALGAAQVHCHGRQCTRWRASGGCARTRALPRGLLITMVSCLVMTFGCRS